MKNHNQDELGLANLHVISAPDRQSVVFDPSSLTVFRVGQKAGMVLQEYAAGREIEALSISHGVSAESIVNMVSRFSKPKETPTAESSSPRQTIRHSLGKLVLNISNSCNLHCKYCYALGGSYGKEPGLMEARVATMALDRVLAFWNELDAIMLFGGEPCLNVEAIRAVCRYLGLACETGRLSRMPILGMVTNGTVMTDELVNLISTYGINVTISLDGRQEVNDLLRVFVNGRGSFQRVAQNIRRLRSATGGKQPRQLEATYTKRHVEQGISTDDLARYFRSEFAIKNTYIAPVSLPMDSPVANELGMFDVPLPSCLSGTGDFVSAFASDDPLQFGDIYDYVYRLATHRCSPYLCNVGISSITIDANGYVYPCYAIMHDDLCMGNISDPEVFVKSQFTSVANKFLKHNKDSIDSCRYCWARPLCHLCYGLIKNVTGSIWHTSPYLCEWVRRRAETALLAISEIQADPDAWRKFVKNATQYRSLEDSSRPVDLGGRL